MVTIQLLGGLGNQMFQYAFARTLQLELKTTLCFDISFYEKRKERNLSLLKLRLIPNISFGLIPKYLLYSSFVLDRISRKFAAKVLLKKHYLFWPTNLPFPYKIKYDLNKNYYVYGYWQEEMFFNKYKDIISKELEVISDMSSSDAKLINIMKNTKSVCIHIRRGDYIKCNYIVCNPEYYQKGIAIMETKIENPHFFVFSDDMEWVKQNINFPGKTTFVDDGKHQDYEIMRLMYSCSNFIISNSTFSWWAQYLSKNDNKIVVAPKKWFPDNNDYSFLYLDNWITI